MRTRFDQFSKSLLADCLEDSGQVETERETRPEVQRVDVWFRPSPHVQRSWVHDKPVLATIVQRPSLLEPFHQTPGVAEILRCVGKQQTVFGELRRKNKKAVMPTMWIISSGRPWGAIRQLGLSPAPEIACGVYAAPPGFRLRLVVVSELPKTPSTLLLRLLGAGRTFRDALQELEGLPADAWEVRTSLPLLIRYQLEIKSLPVTERTAEEEAIMVAHELYEKWERERVERGKALGLAQGLALLVRLYERRLGRELTEAERGTLRERLSRLGPARVGDVVLDLGAEELADWLADPEAG